MAEEKWQNEWKVKSFGKNGGINKENTNEGNKHERQVTLDTRGSLRKTARGGGGRRRSWHCGKPNYLL